MIFFILLALNCVTRVASTENFSLATIEPKTFLIQPAYDYSLLSSKNQLLDLQLHQVIETGLIKKGLIVAHEPDYYVCYLVNVYLSSELRNDENYPYCGYDFMYPHYYSAMDIEEGVLIIDLRNHSGELVWQGIKPFYLASTEEVHELLPEICRKIIKTYKYTL